jgi:CHAT domain-containing protein
VIAASLLGVWLALAATPDPFVAIGSNASAAQRESPSNTSNQSAEVALPLDPQKPVESRIAAATSHHYLLDLAEGQFVRLSLEKQSADLILIATRPDGARISEARAAGHTGAIGIVLVSQSAGQHRVEVRSLAKDGVALPYKLTVAELRLATETDHNRVAAAKAYTEGARLFESNDEQSLREAIEKLKSAALLFRSIGERKDEAAMMEYIGIAHQRLKQYSAAVESAIEAAAIYRAIADPRGEAAALSIIGRSYSFLGERQKAIDHFSQAVPLFRAAGNRDQEAVTLEQIARVHIASGGRHKAIDFFDQAIVAYHESGNGRGEAQTLYAAGSNYFSLDENEKALRYLEKALPLYRATGDRRGEVLTMNGSGRCYFELGQYQKALDLFLQVLSYARTSGQRDLEAPALNSLGQVYSRLGDYQRALDSYQQALLLYQAEKNRRGEASAHTNIGAVYISLDQPQKAIEDFNKALALVRALDDPRSEATVLNGTAGAYVLMKQNEKAIELYNLALPKHRTAGNRLGEAAVLNNIGRVYFSLGDHKKAIELHSQAVAIIRSLKEMRGEAQMAYNLARAHRALGELAEARPNIESAIRNIESMRQEVSDQQLRASLLASARNFYDLKIDLLMGLHKRDPSKRLDLEAFSTSERAHARSLVELLGEARVDIRQGVDPSLLERERTLQQLLTTRAGRQAQLLSSRHTPEQAAAAAREIDSVLSQYQSVQAQVRAASPRYAALAHPELFTIEDARTQLDSETLLLEFALGEDRSFLWVVSTGSVSSHELPGRADIESAARQLYELLSKSGARSRDQPQLEIAAESLSRMLLSPVAAQLESKRLVIVPDGILHYIPFGALPAPQPAGNAGAQRPLPVKGKPAAPARRWDYVPLIARHEIVTLPSASVLAELRRDLLLRKPAPKAIAVFADPVFSSDDPRAKGLVDSGAETASAQMPGELRRAAGDVGLLQSFARLPFSRREAQGITSVAPPGDTMAALDFKANRETATADELGAYRVIHFATHGILDSKHPELSGVVLSLVDAEGRPQDGFLRLHQIYNMKLPAELIVLSACQTGLGKEIRGEGLVGLTRGFMYAGTPRVVASLWKVDDAATADLMKRFYRAMFVTGLRPAAALRQAQIEMWKQQRWKEPYYWAAFTLQGEWK